MRVHNLSTILGQDNRTYLFAIDVRLFLLSGHYNLDFRIYLKFVFCCLEFI
jgi:hypothetical protein